MEDKKILKMLDEFSVKGCEYILRFKKIKPTTLLALITQLGDMNFKVTENTYDFILENTEVKVEGQWVTLKQGGVYFPVDLETNLLVLQKIITKFVDELLTPVFTNSGE